jgi:hypothetical protein
MVLFSVSTPSRLSLLDQDSSRPYELPSALEYPALDGAVCRTAFSKTGAFACATEAGSVYVWEDASRPNKMVQVVKGLRVSGMRHCSGEGREGTQPGDELMYADGLPYPSYLGLDSTTTPSALSYSTRTML